MPESYNICFEKLYPCSNNLKQLTFSFSYDHDLQNYNALDFIVFCFDVSGNEG